MAVRNGTEAQNPLTLHLVGPGQVGRAFMRLLPGTDFRLTGVTDSAGTVHSADQLQPLELARHKAGGRSIGELPTAEFLCLRSALDRVAADVVVDATPTDLSQADSAVRRSLEILDRGAGLVFASKAALYRAGERLLAEGTRERIGINAVFGGTGHALLKELASLQSTTVAVALVGNASTTAVIEAIEAGKSIEDGVSAAQADGLLEPDPELDVSGTDSAIKLVSVVRALWGRDVALDEVSRVHLSTLDLDLVRSRADRGRTTRLVGRATADGGLSVDFEGVSLTSALAVPSSRVVYSYLLNNGETRLHVGSGLGPKLTAAAVLRDVESLASTPRS